MKIEIDTAKLGGALLAVCRWAALQLLPPTLLALAVVTHYQGCQGPAPAPEPPAPQPVPPAPAPPAPIPLAGLRVLVVYDSKGEAEYPAPQREVLYALGVREYLDAKCAPGPDGLREWRIWPASTDPRGEAPWLRDAFARPRQSLPWLVVSNGRAGFEGPLPGSIDETLATIRRYEP